MKIKKVIIIVPATLQTYWKQELQTWCPSIPVRLFEDGSKPADQEKVMKKLKNKGGILVCSYGKLTSRRLYISELRYDILVMDEGHKAKNVETELRKAASSLSVKSHRLLLTGTPLQNNLSELWSVFDFVQPGIFGSRDPFVKKYAEPIEKGLMTDSNPKQK